MYSTAIFVVINLALIGGSLGQNFAVPDTILQNANIPSINASALPIEEAKTAIRNKCEANGGPLAFNRSENAAKQIEQCVRGLVNVTQLNEEIEQAKPTGDLDIVFRRYCAKSPTLKGCVRNFTGTVEACFEPKERENIRLIQNITDSLLQFVCFKEGDRIALFIAAGGPECFVSKQQEIQNCLNSTFGSYIPAEGLNPTSPNGLDNIPLLLLDTKECRDIQKLQRCIVKELEKCSDPTPGNIVDSLFNFIKKVTPCEHILAADKTAHAERSVGRVTGSSTVAEAHIIAVALSLFALRFV